MDKIISTALCLFLIILAPFAGILAYDGYVETAYRNTITGTYTYTCSISTDAPLYNVTLFIPVPADGTGNSPMVSAFSSRTMKGIPADWETTLFDTGKATMLKVTTAAILPPAGTTASSPFTVTFSSETVSRSPVETQNPAEKGIIFRPAQAMSKRDCPQGGSPRCFTYKTSVYADYGTSGNTTVTITSALSGRNTWKIFEPRSNEYHMGFGIMLKGENHGWAVPEGEMSCSIGSYDSPADLIV